MTRVSCCISATPTRGQRDLGVSGLAELTSRCNIRQVRMQQGRGKDTGAEELISNGCKQERL